MPGRLHWNAEPKALTHGHHPVGPKGALEPCVVQAGKEGWPNIEFACTRGATAAAICCKLRGGKGRQSKGATEDAVAAAAGPAACAAHQGAVDATFTSRVDDLKSFLQAAVQTQDCCKYL